MRAALPEWALDLASAAVRHCEACGFASSPLATLDKEIWRVYGRHADEMVEALSDAEHHPCRCGGPAVAQSTAAESSTTPPDAPLPACGCDCGSGVGPAPLGAAEELAARRLGAEGVAQAAGLTRAELRELAQWVVELVRAQVHLDGLSGPDIGPEVLRLKTARAGVVVAGLSCIDALRALAEERGQ